MSNTLPPTMRSLAAPTYCEPSGYEILEVPTPAIKGPKDILIKVHAATIMTGDALMASGKMKMLAGKTEYVLTYFPPSFPPPSEERCYH